MLFCLDSNLFGFLVQSICMNHSSTSINEPSWLSASSPLLLPNSRIRIVVVVVVVGLTTTKSPARPTQSNSFTPRSPTPFFPPIAKPTPPLPVNYGTSWCARCSNGDRLIASQEAKTVAGFALIGISIESNEDDDMRSIKSGSGGRGTTGVCDHLSFCFSCKSPIYPFIQCKSYPYVCVFIHI